MKRTLVFSLAALLLVAPAVAHADDASKHAKIEEMLRLTKMDQNITKVIDQAKGEIRDMVDEQREGAAALPPAQAKIMNDFETKVSDLVTGVLKLEDIHPMMVKLYDETYTEADLDGILAFYKTSAGQTLLNKTPDLMDKVMGLVQQRVTSLSPEVDKLSEQMQKEMEASRQPAAGAAPQSPAAAPGPSAPSNPAAPAGPPAPATPKK